MKSFRKSTNNEGQSGARKCTVPQAFVLAYSWLAPVTSLLACGFLTSSASAVAGTTISHTQGDVEEVAARLSGVMDSSAQAQRDPTYYNVRLVSCPVQIADADANDNSIVLYLEQAMSFDLSHPYRVRFYRISLASDGSHVESQVYVPPNPESLVGFCNLSSVHQTVSLEKMGTSECSVYMTRQGENYVGSTREPEGCPSNLRGAVKMTSEVVLRPDGADTWDRGYDAEGRQVWGAVAGPYEFRRIAE